MKKKDFKILFLDDEIFSDEEPYNPAIIARHELEDAGYNVDVTDKMSIVIESFYQKYYHLYILDIDMGKVSDSFDGNGTAVGEILKRMSSISNIVIYSARGKLNDWLKAANLHFNYYLHKEKGEEKLLEITNKIFNKMQHQEIKIPAFKKKKHENTVFIYYKSCQISKDFIKSQFDNPESFDSLELLIEKLQNSHPKLVVIAFATLPGISKLNLFITNLKKITKQQPYPNVIVCIEASRGGKQILKIVNARPFRILNIESPAFEKEYRKAIKDAILWYGEEEIFAFPAKDRMKGQPMTKKEIEALKPNNWEFDSEDDDVSTVKEDNKELQDE